MSAVPSSQASALLSSFTSFLTVAIHSLLFQRNLYPATSFLVARAYNLPVHQSRHPQVCAWVRDAVSAVAEQLRLGAVQRIALVVHAPEDRRVLERWVFDVRDFPAWGEDDRPDDEEEDGSAVNWTDVHEALRGALRRLAYAGESMAVLPEGCTFTLAVELRDDAEAPVGHPQPWIPSSADLQPPTKGKPNQGSSLGLSSTSPIRSVRADPLFFECWVEKAEPAAS